jgi:hypothetical protein
MFSVSKLLGATALVAAVALASAPASAGYIDSFGTTGYNPQVTDPAANGNPAVTSRSANLGSATSVTFGSEYITSSSSPVSGTNPLSSAYFNSPFDYHVDAVTFSPALFTVTTATSGTLSVSAGSPFTLSWYNAANGIYWVATATSATFARTAASLTLDFLGNVTAYDDAAHTVTDATYGTQSFSFADSFTQTTNGASITEAGSFATPVAEPISMTVIGAGLAGLVAARRRRRV